MPECFQDWLFEIKNMQQICLEAYSFGIKKVDNIYGTYYQKVYTEEQ